jgi:FkbM family methyltransferase
MLRSYRLSVMAHASSVDWADTGVRYAPSAVATHRDTDSHIGRSSFYYLWSIPRQILRHPNNRRRALRGLAKSIWWQGYKRLAKRPITVPLFETMKLRCYPDSVSASNVMYFGDYYEFDEMLFVRRYRRPGDGFIDGGANIGTYSLLAAKIAGPSGRVEAFEPDRVAALRLRENIALNALSNVKVHEAALSDTPGRFRFAQGWDVSNRLVYLAETGMQTAEVDTVRLDDQLEPNIAYEMAKLDLEGSELAALHGARKHLLAANPPVWQLEAMESQLLKQGTSRKEVTSFLRDCGYRFASYDAKSGRLRFLEDLPPTLENFFAIHSSAREIVLERLKSDLR